MLTGLPLKFCFSCWDKAQQAQAWSTVCSRRFQYSGGMLNTGKNCFQSRVKKCTLSCSRTDRCVWQTWFSEVLPSVPARGIRLYCTISPFRSVSCKHAPFIPFFSYLFSVFLSPSVFVSSFQGFGLKKWIHPPFISPSCFFFHIPFYRFSLTLFLCRTFLHDDATTLPLYLLCPLLTLSFPSHFLSHSPSLPLIEVLERGNEKCMYSVAVQCGSRRENCCFMVLFMDL